MESCTFKLQIIGVKQATWYEYCQTVIYSNCPHEAAYWVWHLCVTPSIDFSNNTHRGHGCYIMMLTFMILINGFSQYMQRMVL